MMRQAHLDLFVLRLRSLTLASALVLAACPGDGGVTPTPGSSPQPTSQPDPTPTERPTATEIVDETPTPTGTSAPTETPTEGATPNPGGLDLDGDGYSKAQGDCDDSDPARRPFAVEGVDVNGDGIIDGDGVDNNCNNLIDDGTGDFDDDGDGANENGSGPSGEVDCDDRLNIVGPRQPEVCSGRDDDCDGLVDNVGQDQTRCVSGAVTCVTESSNIACDSDSDCDDVNCGSTYDDDGDLLQTVCAPTTCDEGGHCLRTTCDAGGGSAGGLQATGNGDGLICDSDDACGDGAFCKEGVCASLCDSDADCGDARCTVNGRCGECSLNLDCDAGEVCNDRARCVDRGCYEDDDCDDGFCTPDGLCEAFSDNIPPERVGIVFHPCDDPASALTQLSYPRGVSELEVCVSAQGLDGEAIDDEPITAAFAVLSRDGASDPYRDEPLLTLSFPGGGAAYSQRTGTWTVDLTPGAPATVLLTLGDAGYDEWYDASPTVRAASGVAPSDLTVLIPGRLGGAFRGVLQYDNGIMSDRAITAIVDPSGYPSHAIVLPGGDNGQGDQDLLGTLTETQASGERFTATWWEPLDIDGLGARLGGSLDFPILNRSILRRFELTLTDTSTGAPGRDRYEGTFVETIRGLAPGDITFSGVVNLGEAPLISDRYDEALDDGDAPFWTEAPSYEADFASAAFSPAAQVSGLCSTDYNRGSGGLARARCLETGEGDCGFEGPATVLAQHLAGVEAVYGANPGDSGYALSRFASTGVCDVELDLYFQQSDYEGGQTRAAPYSAFLEYAPGGGSCDDGQAGDYVYTPGDPDFAPCCVDPNRLHCAAEYFSFIAAFGASGEERDDARAEVWGPIAGLFAAHIYDLQEMRLLEKEAEYLSDLGGFTAGERLNRREATVARLLPPLKALLQPNILSGLDASAQRIATDCAEGAECPYVDAMGTLTGSLFAHMDALESLGVAWQQNRSAGGTLNSDRGVWLAKMGQLELMTVAYLQQLAGLDGTGAMDALTGRVQGLRAQGGRLDTVGGRITFDINPWGYPNNYIPNPTISDTPFETRLLQAASRIVDAATKEGIVSGEVANAEQSKAADIARLEAKIAYLKSRRRELCGGNASGPSPLDACGEVQGALYDAFQTLLAKVQAEERAGRLLDQVVDRIQVKEAEAQASYDALQQLRDEYRSNYRYLQSELDAIEANYIAGWRERFEDYQEEKAELYAQLRDTYEALHNDLQVKRAQLQEERQQTLDAKCDAMEENLETVRTEQVEARQTACDDIVGCLRAAESKRKKKKRRRRIFKAIVTLGLSEISRAVRGGDRGPSSGCAASCRQETECNAEIEILESASQLRLDQLAEECAFEETNLANDARQAMEEARAQEQSLLAQLQFEQQDARLEEWMRFREEQMRFQIERQEDRAQRAARQADRQSGVFAQAQLARAQFDSEIAMLMIDLGEVDATLEEIEAEVDGAADHLARLYELAEATFEEERALTLQLEAAAQDDPAYRMVDDERVALLDTFFDRAREFTWLALRAYEFETSTAFEYADLLNDAMTAEQLCGLAQCLDDSYQAYTTTYTSQGNKERILSARELLGLSEGVVDTRTGDGIDPGRRFGAHLSSTNQLAFEPGNGYTWGVRIQTHSTPRGSWSWDANRCNEKIESVQVLVVCEGCTPRPGVEVRVGPSGAMLYHSCQTSGSRGFDDIGFDAPEDLSGFEGTLTAAVIEPPPNGDYLSIPESVWDQAEANTELAGLNPIFPAWNLRLVPPETAPANTALTVPAVQDILLRINYRDQNATAWGGVEADLPNCEAYVPISTVLQPPGGAFTCNVLSGL